MKEAEWVERNRNRKEKKNVKGAAKTGGGVGGGKKGGKQKKRGWLMGVDRHMRETEGHFRRGKSLDSPAQKEARRRGRRRTNLENDVGENRSEKDGLGGSTTREDRRKESDTGKCAIALPSYFV